MADKAQVAASLSQLEGAIEAYLALGSDTPLASSAQSWLEDVRGELEHARTEETEAPEVEEPESESEDSPPSDFRGATRAAAKAMRDGNLGGDRGGTKTEDEEQSPGDEEEKKKRTKAY